MSSPFSLPNGTQTIAALDDDRNVMVNVAVADDLTVSPATSDIASIPDQLVIGTSSIQILAANQLRKRLAIQNIGTTRIYLVFGTASASSNSFHVALPAGGSTADGTSPIWQDTMWLGAVQAISSGTGGLVSVTEFT